MRDVADMTGVCIATISKIETGRTTNPTPRTKRDLAEALGYEIDELWPASGRTSNRELREWARALKAGA